MEVKGGGQGMTRKRMTVGIRQGGVVMSPPTVNATPLDPTWLACHLLASDQFTSITVSARQGPFSG